MRIHVVASGDTLWAVARRYGTDMNQIILANQIENPDVLVVGQALVIPEPGREYVVQPGDTLWAIAQRFGVPVQELAQVNQITNPALIFVGDMLVLPYFPYRVRSGDTLWQIARRFGTTVDRIVQVNPISNPAMLSVGQVLYIPREPRPVTEINAYITNTGEEGRSEVLALGRNFTYLSPFTYSIREDGSITDMRETPVLEAAQATAVAPLLVLTNFRDRSFDSDVAATILRSPELQETLITNLMETMEAKGYSGLNVDFEYVYPEDRENYNDFLRRAVARMRPAGYTVSTALAPKESADQAGLLYEAHDYAAHGEILDFVVIMTYEWGWAGGEPWAIAPINKVRDVLDYAVREIPPEKILMGIPLYGRDWKIPWQQGTYGQSKRSRAACRPVWGRYSV